MRDFVLKLQSSIASEEIAHVVSFVAEDASGSFGIMAGHERFITCLQFGLMWFRTSQNEIKYLALPGGVLYFVNNELIINTRYYLQSDDYEELANQLAEKMQKEEKGINDIKGILHNLDKGMLRHLRKMKQAELL